MVQVLLNRNETTQGPSPDAMKVLQQFSRAKISMYQAGYFPSLLRPVLSQAYVIPEDQIIISYGSEELLRLVFDTLVAGRDSVLTHQYHYSYYLKYLDFKGVQLSYFRMPSQDRSFLFDVDHCITQYEEIKPKVLIINSPNNPTGNSISMPDLIRILDHVDPATLVILDQAYIEYERGVHTQDGCELLARYPNLMLLRSFSKLYALAGLRIGYALCGTSVKNMLSYQDRYLGMSTLVEEVAIAAFHSTEYYTQVRNEVISHRQWFLQQTLAFDGFTVYESNGNFVLARISDTIRHLFNAAIEPEKRIIGKYVDVDLYRISLGEPKDSQRLIDIMTNICVEL